ncbi:hypothetical protein F2Q69_00044117 [Brassica cretica]|uniref:Uncharacterized protein n=1 Tax=Brassica cretica TaxID=69181 RepID=A0A8S9NG51_BRACR|nr:hypothetical protein F2Q69_00044117 [Brassica cretica]
MNSAAPPGSPASPEADLRGEARDEGSTVGMARLVADSKKVVPTSPEADLRGEARDEGSTVGMARLGLETALSQNGNIGEVATPVAEDVETVVAEDVAEDVELDGINKEEVLAENMETVVAEEELELNASKNGELVTKIGENEVLGETNKLLLVSSSKVGRSPVRFTLKNQTSDFQISGSKFSVLSNDEEEEGEITGDGLQNLAVVETLVNNDSVNAEEDDGVNTTSNHAEEKAKETHMKGATKEKKAKETAQLPSYDTCILGLD